MNHKLNLEAKVRSTDTAELAGGGAGRGSGSNRSQMNYLNNKSNSR